VTHSRHSGTVASDEQSLLLKSLWERLPALQLLYGSTVSEPCCCKAGST
jgi:hypothetical protein